jgi:7-cyano-7-deazaguanine tRNA-ribosyltransferase
VRHIDRLARRYSKTRDFLLVFEETPQKPFTRGGLIKEIISADKDLPLDVDFIVLSASFSVIPLELDGLYPFSQYEASGAVFSEASSEILADLVWFVLNKGYKGVILVYYSLPRGFVYELQQRLLSNSVVFTSIWVDDYDEALKNPGEVIRKIRLVLQSFKNIFK